MECTWITHDNDRVLPHKRMVFDLESYMIAMRAPHKSRSWELSLVRLANSGEQAYAASQFALYVDLMSDVKAFTRSPTPFNHQLPPTTDGIDYSWSTFNGVNFYQLQLHLSPTGTYTAELFRCMQDMDEMMINRSIYHYHTLAKTLLDMCGNGRLIKG